MWQRYSWYDVRVIGHYLGVLISFFTLALAVPFFTAIIFQEWEPASRYFLAIGIALIIGSLLRFLRIQPGRLDTQQAIAVTGLAWLLLALIAAVPLALSGHYGSYLDALFESMSGLTTTGASIAVDLNHMSNADNMWRFVMHLLGGLGLIVVALSLGLLGKGASGLYATEGRSEHLLPNIVTTAQLIARIALIVIGLVTVALTFLCWLAGMELTRAFLHALWLSISGFMTAGFAPMSQSIMYYHSFPLEFVCILLMMLGAINFALFVEAWKGNTRALFRDLEIRTGVLWMIVAGVVFMLSLAGAALFSDLPALLRRGVFMIVSASTTTGFQVVTSNQLVTVFSSGAFLVLAMLMAVGGSSGSTSGGIKFARIGLIAKSLVSTIKETLSPERARVSVSFFHIRKQVLSTDIARGAMTVSALFILTFLIGSLVGIAHGYEATHAIFESVAMASNGGLSSGIVTRGMPVTLEMIYIVQMWAGRLEFIALLALLVKVVISLKPRAQSLAPAVAVEAPKRMVRRSLDSLEGGKPKVPAAAHLPVVAEACEPGAVDCAVGGTTAGAAGAAPSASVGTTPAGSVDGSDRGVRQ